MLSIVGEPPGGISCLASLKSYVLLICSLPLYRPVLLGLKIIFKMDYQFYTSTKLTIVGIEIIALHFSFLVMQTVLDHRPSSSFLNISRSSTLSGLSEISSLFSVRLYLPVHVLNHLLFDFLMRIVMACSCSKLMVAFVFLAHGSRCSTGRLVNRDITGSSESGSQLQSIQELYRTPFQAHEMYCMTAILFLPFAMYVWVS